MSKSTSFHWITAISEITPEDIYIRGYAMQDLVGRLPYSGIAYLILTGRLPNPGEWRMTDIILSSILDYGLEKSGTVAARAVVSVNPQMTAGLGAGVLAAGEYALSPQPTGTFLLDARDQWIASGEDMDSFAEAFVAKLRAEKRRVPGFGHQVFRGVDPRAEKLKRFAIDYGVWGEINELYEAVHRAFKKAANKPDLVLNDVGMLAGIMTQMGFTPKEMEGLAILSTFPGLIAHISEEIQSGAINRIVAPANAEYVSERKDVAADLTAAGW